MKNKLFLSILCIIAITSKAQLIGYNYDFCGNRVQRVLGISSANRVANNDSLPSYHESTMQLAMQYGVSVFPNPTSTNINIVTNKIPEGETATITLYDNMGRTLRVIPNITREQEISLQDYKQGIYNIAIVISNKDKLFYKVIKQ